MLKELRRIFNYYKKEYKLNTKLIFKNNEICGFYINEDCIGYDLSFVIKEINNEIIEQLTKRYDTKKHLKPIFCLLHEIGHAIDWKYNNRQYKIENERVCSYLYHFDYKYAMSVPFEKRANKFAKKEIKKWIK